MLSWSASLIPSYHFFSIFFFFVFYCFFGFRISDGHRIYFKRGTHEHRENLFTHSELSFEAEQWRVSPLVTVPTLVSVSLTLMIRYPSTIFLLIFRKNPFFRSGLWGLDCEQLCDYY